MQFGRALSGHAGQGDLHQFADHRKREHASLIRNGGAKIRAEWGMIVVAVPKGALS